MNMVKETYDIINTKPGLFFFLGVLTGMVAVVAGIATLVIPLYPDIVERFDKQRAETIRNLEDEKQRITDKAIQLDKEIVALRSELSTRPLGYYFMAESQETKEILPDLHVRMDLRPNVNDNGSFEAWLAGDIFKSPRTIIRTSDPYEFAYQGKPHFLIVEPAKPYEDDRIKLTVFSGPAR